MNGGIADGRMRLVVVNHRHPSVPHVSGMRAWYFACDLAARGHQVVLICEWTEGAQSGPDPASVERLLRVHDWSRPLIVAVRPSPVALLDCLRSPEVPAMFRKALVAWSYLTQTGVFTDFSRAARPVVQQLARVFKPEAVWGSFGNTDCWLVAQQQARLAGCGWVSDMKDAWDWWVPTGLRTWLARRFQDMAASTANAGFHAGVHARWFPTQPVVVYSGVDQAWLQPASRPDGDFLIVLVGGTYGQIDLDRFVRGCEAWVRSVPSSKRGGISFHYAGSDAARIKAAVTNLATLIRVEIRGYLPLSELSALCRDAAVNAYLWSPTTFHHKVVELLCSRRPVISFPGERAESLELARLVGGSLNVCRDEQELQTVLGRIWEGELTPQSGLDRLQSLTWAAQGDRLEEVLRRVAMDKKAVGA